MLSSLSDRPFEMMRDMVSLMEDFAALIDSSPKMAAFVERMADDHRKGQIKMSISVEH